MKPLTEESLSLHKKQHELSNENTTPSTCVVCSTNFDSQSILIQHVRKMHLTGYDLFFCEFCSDVFESKFVLLEHKDSEHKDSREIMSTAALITGRKVVLTANAQRLTAEADPSKSSKILIPLAERKKKCKLCPFVDFANKLKVHKLKNHTIQGKPFVCEVCGAAFKLATRLEIHKFQNHTESIDTDVHKCPVEGCKKIYPSLDLAQEHLQSHKNMSECKFCKKRFLAKERFYVHMNNAHRHGMLLTCAHCSKGFNDQSELEEHEAAHKTNMLKLTTSRTTPYKCMLCPKNFNCSAALFDHVNIIHEKLQVYRCERCVITFNCKDSYDRHISLHLHPSRLRCDQCSFICTVTHTLKAHQDLHSIGNLPYKCSLCGKGFVEREEWNDHCHKDHQEIYQLQCNACGMNFKNPVTFKKHISLHGKGYFHNCVFCDRWFFSPLLLVVHVELIHKEGLFLDKEVNDAFVKRLTAYSGHDENVGVEGSTPADVNSVVSCQQSPQPELSTFSNTTANMVQQSATVLNPQNAFAPVQERAFDLAQQTPIPGPSNQSQAFAVPHPYGSIEFFASLPSSCRYNINPNFPNPY